MKIQVKVFDKTTDINTDSLNNFFRKLDSANLINHRSFSNQGEICHTVTYYEN